MDDLYMQYVRAIGTPAEWEMLARYEAAAGPEEEEPEEEYPEDTNCATNWDEWAIDHAIDIAREDQDV